MNIIFGDGKKWRSWKTALSRLEDEESTEKLFLFEESSQVKQKIWKNKAKFSTTLKVSVGVGTAVLNLF